MKELSSAEKAKKIYSALDEKKAADIEIIDIRDISVIADYFIIAGGSNANQVKALVDNVELKLGMDGVSPGHTEGYQTANWVLMDYSDVIVHVFNNDDRRFYDLERIWRDGKFISLDEL